MKLLNLDKTSLFLSICSKVKLFLIIFTVDLIFWTKGSVFLIPCIIIYLLSLFTKEKSQNFSSISFIFSLVIISPLLVLCSAQLNESSKASPKAVYSYFPSTPFNIINLQFPTHIPILGAKDGVFGKSFLIVFFCKSIAH